MEITSESIGLMSALASITAAQTELHELMTGLISCCIILIALVAFVAVTHR